MQGASLLTSADIKSRKLAELEKRMRKKFSPRILWFFEDDSGRIAGYEGTEPVMFVAQRPSGGTSRGKGIAKSNTHRPGGFFSLLVEYGFKHAHITDLVKESMKAGLLWTDQIDRNWPYFQEEVAIIQPTILVAIGGEVHGILKRKMGNRIPIEKMVHYAYRFKPRNIETPQRIWLEEQMRADLTRIRRRVNASTGI